MDIKLKINILSNILEKLFPDSRIKFESKIPESNKLIGNGIDSVRAYTYTAKTGLIKLDNPSNIFRMKSVPNNTEFLIIKIENNIKIYYLNGMFKYYKIKDPNNY